MKKIRVIFISEILFFGLLFFITSSFDIKSVEKSITSEAKPLSIATVFCDFFTNEDLHFPDFAIAAEFENSLYLIIDAAGQMVQTSEDFPFSPIETPGTYSVIGLFYEGTVIVSSTGGGINTNSFVPTGAYFWSEPLVFQVCTPPEICGNNIDDDNDGLIDNEDDDCACSFYINFARYDYCNVCENLGLEVRTPFWNGLERAKKDIPNLAWKKPTQYVNRPNGIAANASSGVDGNKDGDLTNSLGVITREMNNPWWEVDLIGNFNINELKIYGREDCCQTEINNYHIFISATPFASLELNTLASNNDIFHLTHTTTGGQDFTLPILNEGRFIRIYAAGYTQLQIAEVEVFGEETEDSLPYSYEWNRPNSENKPTFTCEDAGQYCVTVTDNATGCTIERCIEVN